MTIATVVFLFVVAGINLLGCFFNRLIKLLPIVEMFGCLMIGIILLSADRVSHGLHLLTGIWFCVSGTFGVIQWFSQRHELRRMVKRQPDLDNVLSFYALLICAAFAGGVYHFCVA